MAQRNNSFFLSGKQHGPHRIDSFDSIKALLNTVELPPADRIPRTAVLKIVEPYFSQLSESGLPQWPYPPPRPIDTVTRCT